MDMFLSKTGKLLKSEAAEGLVLTADTVQIDVSGKVIMPGLVDSHSHIGEVSGADSSSPIQPAIRTLDSINARSSSIQRAQTGGGHDGKHHARFRPPR